MPAYIVAKVNIHDRDTYKRYEAGFMEAFEPFGGKILGLDENPEILEGTWPVTRTVILEFPSVEVAKAWYHSDAYQKVVKHRFRAADADLAIIRGFAAR